MIQALKFTPAQSRPLAQRRELVLDSSDALKRLRTEEVASVFVLRQTDLVVLRKLVLGSLALDFHWGTG